MNIKYKIMDKIITEDYVSYDTAKLLRKKGFDEPCRSAYLWNGEEEELCTSFSNHIQFNSEDCEDGDIPRISAPTLQMAKKWLRVVHNIVIQTELYSNLGDYCFEVFKNTHRMIVEKDEVYNSYEKRMKKR